MTLFRDIDKRDWVYQPNFVRRRHRFRGPRESLKINQEIAQFLFDTKRIFELCEDNEATLEDNVDVILDGATVDVSGPWTADDTPDDSPLDFLGLEELMSKVEQAKKRVNALRGNNG